MRYGSSLAFCAFACLFGCDSSLVPATQLLVEVSSDLDGIASIETAVFDAREQKESDVQTYAVPADITLPFSFAVVPASDRAASSAIVSVTARDASGAFLVQAKALVRFRERASLVVPLALKAACRDQRCEAGHICVAALASMARCAPLSEQEQQPDGGVQSEGMTPAVDAGSDALVSVPQPMEAGVRRDAGEVLGSTDAAVADAAPSDSFPRTSEPATVTTKGLYAVATYSEGLDPLLKNAAVYYPQGARPPYAAVALVHEVGREAVGQAWATHLAAHGFVALVANDVATGRTASIAQLELEVSTLRAENSRSGGPLEGKLDVSRFGLFGWHGSAGTALRVANGSAAASLRAVATFAPWVNDDANTRMQFPNVSAATVVFCGTRDTVYEPVRHARPSYESIRAPKAYFELADLTYEGTPSVSETSAARIMIAWFKLYLESDPRYETYVTGAKFEEVRSQLAAHTTSNR